MTWDDASYSAGQEALKGLLKNWDSSGMVARATASPSEVVNKFLGNAHAQTLLSSCSFWFCFLITKSGAAPTAEDYHQRIS